MTFPSFDFDSIVSALPVVYDRLRVDGAIVYTADPGRPVIHGGSLLVERSMIKAVGTSQEIDAIEASLGPSMGRTRRIDARGKMLLPGLVDNHWHDSSALRALQSLTKAPDDSDTEPSLMSHGGQPEKISMEFNGLFDVAKNLPPDVARASAVYSYVTHLRAGTTCVADFGSLNHPDVLAQAVLDTGIRGVVSVYSVDGECRPEDSTFTRTRDTDELLGEIEGTLSRYRAHASGRLRAMPSVLWSVNASDELLTGAAALANRFDTPWGSHVAAICKESATSQRYFGVRGAERLHRLGLLSQRLISAHTAFADEDEFDWLVRSGVNLTYSAQKYGISGESPLSGTKQILRFLKAGAPVCWSSDGDPSPVGHMPESMRMGWLACNEMSADPSTVTPMRALAMGTRLAAESLQWSHEIGSLSPGKKADFIMVSIEDWRYVGVRRPLNIFLSMGGSNDIDTVVVDGRILVEKGALTFVDERALAAAFMEQSIALSEALGQGAARVPS